jgi:hypothetical protein
MPILLIISKKGFDGSATKFKENVLTKEEPNIQWNNTRGQNQSQTPYWKEQGFYKIL